jgi:hypothetical protein
MDRDARERLLKKIYAIDNEGSTLVAVGLDEFFEGNSDEKSIGVNLPAEKHIGLAGFRNTLESIRERTDVQDIFIELTEIPILEEEEDDDIWPTACVAFIITSAAIELVREWVQPLHPRDVSEGWNVKPGVKTPLADEKLQSGKRPIRVWLL